MRRYLSILGARLRAAIALSAQYRWDFLVDAPVSLLWITVGLLPLLVAFEEQPSVRGWRYPEALLVVGWFTALKGFFSAMFFPSLLELATKVRDGTLDLLLTKPAGALFLISTSRFELWRLIDFLAGLGLIAFALYRLDELPSPLELAAALLLLGASATVLFSLCVIVSAAAFFAVRLEGLPFLFTSILDFGRWPVSIFPGLVQILFTFVIPLGILTTFPAEALLGRLALGTGLYSILGAAAFFLLAKNLFARAIGRYTSASS